MVLLKLLTILYIVKQKKVKQNCEKMQKKQNDFMLMQWSRACASSYSVETLNCFSPELQLKDTQSTVRNRLLDLLVNNLLI